MSRSEGPISSSNSLPRPRGAGAFSDGHNTLPRQREKGAVRIKEGERDRPLSLYDNLKDESPRESPSRSLGPSMASAMVTTVPQNIAAPKIEGRHAPTRTSLRHSRMIVLTRQGKGLLNSANPSQSTSNLSKG